MNKPSTGKALLAELIVDGWTRDFSMGWLVNRYIVEVGQESLDFKGRFALVKDIIGGYIRSDQPIKAFVASNMRRLSELAWSNAPRDRLILAAKQDLGIRKGAKGRVAVAARSLSKDHDWNTVK